MSENRWLLLARMIERSLSVKGGISQLLKMYPKDREIRRLDDELSKGKGIEEILGKDQLERQIRFYGRFLNFEKAISLAVSEKRQKKKRLNEFASALGYPLLLVFCGMGLLWLFSSAVMPQIKIMLLPEENGFLSAEVFLKGLVMLRNLLIGMTLTVSATWAYIKLAHREIYFWMYLHRIKLDGLIRIAVSCRFAERLAILLKSGLDLHSALDVLRFQKDAPLEGLIAHHINESLQQGKGFEESLSNDFLDENFLPLCLNGIKSDDFISALEDYLSVTELKMKGVAKMLSYAIQASCYLFIALVIIAGYRILLLPLEMLEGGM